MESFLKLQKCDPLQISASGKCIMTFGIGRRPQDHPRWSEPRVKSYPLAKITVKVRPQYWNSTEVSRRYAFADCVLTRLRNVRLKFLLTIQPLTYYFKKLHVSFKLIRGTVLEPEKENRSEYHVDIFENTYIDHRFSNFLVARPLRSLFRHLQVIKMEKAPTWSTTLVSFRISKPVDDWLFLFPTWFWWVAWSNNSFLALFQAKLQLKLTWTFCGSKWSYASFCREKFPITLHVFILGYIFYESTKLCGYMLKGITFQPSQKFFSIPSCEEINSSFNFLFVRIKRRLKWNFDGIRR